MNAIEPYVPLNTLKPFGPGVWIVDGPEIRMDYGPTHIPFPTRMVVVRLGSGDLWIHSPIAPDAALFDALDALGPVRHLIAPNSIHYWYMADWQKRYPDAVSYAVADLARKAKRPFLIDHVLEQGACFHWQDEIDWLLVPGTAVTEAIFHVRSASLLILADLIENFELWRVRNPLLRRLIHWGKADGGTPIDLRLTFWPTRRKVRRQIAHMLKWRPERVVMAHGKPYETNGMAELRRAFRWAGAGQ